MAVSRARALLEAQARATWNQARREAGLAGAASTLLLAAVLLFALAGPAWGSRVVGRALGDELPGEALGGPAARRLAGIEAAIVGALALLAGLLGEGASQVLPTLPLLPVGRAGRLAARVASRAVEPLPLLGLVSLCGLATGAVSAHPGAIPLALLHATGAWIGMLLLREVVAAGPRPAVATALVTAAGLAALVTDQDARSFLLLPGTYGYGGLARAMDGHYLGAMLPASLPWLAAALAAAAIARFVDLDRDRVRRLAPARGPLSRRLPPARAIAALWSSSVTAHRTGRVLLGIPMAAGASGAIVAWALRAEPGLAEALPPPPLAFATRLPLAGLLVAVVPFLLSELWSNQFGWLGSGLDAVLALPVETRTVLRALLLGQLRLTAIASVLAAAPLLLVRPPLLREILWGAATGATGAVWLAAFGHVVSARFPRRIDARSAHVPASSALGRAAVSAAAGVAIVPVAVPSFVAFVLAPPWASPVIMLALLLLSLAIHRASLPLLCELVDDQRERLVTIR